LRAKRHNNIPTGPSPPLTTASNAGGVGRNRDAEPISGFMRAVNAATDTEKAEMLNSYFTGVTTIDDGILPHFACRVDDNVFSNHVDLPSQI